MADTYPASTPDPFGQLSAQAPAFNPLGNEMVKQPFLPTPPSSKHDSPIAPHMDLSLYMAHQNLKHTQDIYRLEHALRTSQQRVADIEEAVGNDLRRLHTELAGLKYRQERESGLSQEQGSFALTRGAGVVEVVVPKPEVLLQRGIKEEHVAVLYSEQAEVLKSTALKLERDAAELRGHCVGLLEDREAFEDTPTHVPARRQQRETQPPTTVILEQSAEPGQLGSKRGINANTGKATEMTAGQQEISTPQLHPGKNNNADAEHVTSSVVTKRNGWIPHAVRDMAPSEFLDRADPDPEFFSAEILHFILNGQEWSSGFYFVDTTKPGAFQMLPSNSYWLVNLRTEPFMPKQPGEHGAKLTAFFNETLVGEGKGPGEANYMKVPVFVNVSMDEQKEHEKEYLYFGMYSQSRFSDKIDYDHIVENVPEVVKKAWARELTKPGRPEWVTKALMEHFWPRPKYEGAVPTDSAIATPASMETKSDEAAALEKRVIKALNEYAKELKQWEKYARAQASCISPEMILNAFNEPDAGEVPGLRLWFEYFECTGFDDGFYQMLCQLKATPQVSRFVDERKAVRARQEAVRARMAREEEARAARKMEKEESRVGGGRGAEEAASEQGKVNGVAFERSGEVGSSSEEAQASSPPGSMDKRPANETTDDWPDWEEPTPPSAPGNNPSTTDPAPKSKMLTSKDLFGDWATPKPPVLQEHPSFPSSDLAAVAPSAAVNASGGKGKEKVGWGDLETAKQFQQTATKAKPTARGGRNNGGNGKKVPPHLRRG